MVTPYERWDYYNPNVKSMPQEINYAANKVKGSIKRSMSMGDGKGQGFTAMIYGYGI